MTEKFKIPYCYYCCSCGKYHYYVNYGNNITTAFCASTKRKSKQYCKTGGMKTKSCQCELPKTTNKACICDIVKCLQKSRNQSPRSSRACECDLPRHNNTVPKSTKACECDITKTISQSKNRTPASRTSIACGCDIPNVRKISENKIAESKSIQVSKNNISNNQNLTPMDGGTQLSDQSINISVNCCCTTCGSCIPEYQSEKNTVSVAGSGNNMNNTKSHKNNIGQKSNGTNNTKRKLCTRKKSKNRSSSMQPSKANSEIVYCSNRPNQNNSQVKVLCSAFSGDYQIPSPFNETATKYVDSTPGRPEEPVCICCKQFGRKAFQEPQTADEEIMVAPIMDNKEVSVVDSETRLEREAMQSICCPKCQAAFR